MDAIGISSSIKEKCASGDGRLCEANLWIWRIVPPILLFIGTFGNTTTLAVLCRKSLRSKPMSILGFLAVFDQLFLWSNSSVSYKWNAFPEHIVSTAGTVRVMRYVLFIARSSSNWTVAVFTLERVSAILFPFITKTFLTLTKTRVTVTILTIVQSIYLGYAMLGYKILFTADDDVETVNTTTGCPLMSQDLGESCVIHRIIGMLVVFFVPLTIAMVGNLILIIKFLCCKPATWRDSRPDTQTKMLFAITGFLLTSMMSLIFGIVLRFSFLESGMQNPVDTLIMLLVQIIQLTNHSVNFFLYLGASSLFKAEFKLMCKEISDKIMRR